MNINNNNLKEWGVGLILAGTLFVLFWGIFTGSQQQARIYAELGSQWNATDAIIKTPAILIRVDTAAEFNLLRLNVTNPTVYYYAEKFYIVPDARLGYVYDPRLDLSIWRTIK